MSNTHKKRASLGATGVAMIIISAMFSVRTFPTIAVNGYQSIFLFSAATLLFFLPLSLVCAELGAKFPKQGGVYTWVSAAFGSRVGFIASWLEWINNIFYFVALLSFITSICAYLSKIEFTNGHKMMIMLSFFWSATFFNFGALKHSGLFSRIGAILGGIFPGLVLILLGASVVYRSESYLPSIVEIVPTSWNLGTLSTLSIVMLGFAGIEVSSYYITTVKHPTKTYPRAIFLAAITIFGLSVLCTLSIVALVPQDKINLETGVIQALARFHSEILVHMMQLLMLVGTAALLNTWVISPLKGIITAGKDGFLPPYLCKTNRHGAPKALLITQGILVSLLVAAFTYPKSSEAPFRFIEIITAQLVITMYALVFAACIKLRMTDNKSVVKSTYRIPGGQVGFLLVTLTGLLSCLLSIFLGFMKPDDSIAMEISNGYYALLVMAVTGLAVVPTLFLRKKSQ